MVKTLKNEVDMLNVPVFKGILKMAIPIMVMNVCQSLFNIVDMTMLKAMVNSVTSFFCTCVLRVVWVIFIFPLYPNLTFLYLVWPIGWSIAIITLSTILTFYFKKHFTNNA